jgi:hypothetical protein
LGNRGSSNLVGALGDESDHRFHPDSDIFRVDRTIPLAQANFVQSEVIEPLQAGQFKRVARAIQGTAIDNENAFRFFALAHDAFYTSADTGQTRHLCQTGASQLACNPVGEFPHIRATGAGIDYRGGFIHGSRIWSFGIHYGPTIIRIVWRSFDLSQRITLSRAAHETIKTLTCIKDL